MSAGTLNLTAEQGATFDTTITWQVGNPAAPVDLTGYTARMQIKDNFLDSAIQVAQLTTENGGITLGGALGTIKMTLTAVETAAISVPPNASAPTSRPIRTLVYDLELVKDGYVTRLVEGMFSISGEVTK